MHSQTPCTALSEGLCLEIRYNGYTRLVEVHAVGLTPKGNAVMRVWQVRGGSAHNEPVGWKLLRLDEAVGLGLSDEPSRAPRPGYRKGDSDMARIYCQI